MRPDRPRIALALAVAAPVALILLLGCTRKTSNLKPTAAATQTGATLTTPSPVPSASGTATSTATAAATPVAGASIKVGDATVVIDRFRAQITAAQGVNIRSSPEVTATNRTGSLAPGATVDVEGRVPQGQEAEQGNGTNWFYVGTVGNMPQFIYGPAGTLTPISGSATPSPGTPNAATPTPTATP
jgi:hypothetical protein